MTLKLAFLLFACLLNKIQTKSIDSRIFNGEAAFRGQFPWQVSMTLVKGNRLFFCSGAIISPTWVLTAAHCLSGVSSARVSAGSLKWSGVDLNRETVSSSEIIIHEEFVEETVYNDIGLVKLATPLKYTNLIKPIELGSEYVESDLDVTIAGWGRLQERVPDLSDELRYVNLTTISNEQCIPQIGERYIPKTKICASSPKSAVKSPCMGDSGGSLVLDAFTENPIHIGILSLLSAKGCESGLPSGYSRTSSFRAWIKDKTGL